MYKILIRPYSKGPVRSYKSFTKPHKALDFTNMAWSFTKAGVSDMTLFTALAKVAEHHVGKFEPQLIANVAWAFATAGAHPPKRETDRQSRQTDRQAGIQGDRQTVCSLDRVPG